MSREIDERIVAMYFDNDQFEKGARESLKTLDELKQGMDFQGVGESFEQVSKITSKGFGLKSSTKQVGFFSNAMSKMGKVASGALRTMTAPVNGLMNGLRTVEGYVGKVLGFNLADKLVSTGEAVIRAFTIDPLKTGWNEYELKMDSIKTIMSGTEEEFRKLWGDSYKEEEHLQVVKKALEELNKYADDTIYSFSDMTSNIGKFTNNGVKLETAVRAMKGISNAAALAGQGTQQASMAMYNLSQAIGVGKLTTIDWKSIENANMATMEFKNIFIETAAAMGKLEKKGDKFFTKTKKHEEVTASNFRNTLNEGWADVDVITAALEIFSGDIKAVDLAKYGFDQDMLAYLEELGQKAYKAATEVRTFSKMWDALKEAAQSGWANTWELIFGDASESTNFWTKLNERLSGWLDASSDSRNDLLKRWRGQLTDSDLDELTSALEKFSGVNFGQSKFNGWIKTLDNGKRSIRTLTDELYDFIYVRKLSEGDLIGYLQTDYLMTAEEARNVIEAFRNYTKAYTYLGIDGRQNLIDGVMNLLDGFDNIKAVFSKIKKDLFGEITPEKLQKWTKSFKEFTETFKTWTAGIGDSKAIKDITKGLKGLLNVYKMFWNSLKSVASSAIKLIKPFWDFATNIFGKVGEWLSGIDASKGLSGLFEKLKTLNIGSLLKDLGRGLSGVWRNIKIIANQKDFNPTVRSIVNGLDEAFSTIGSVWEGLFGKRWAVEDNPDNVNPITRFLWEIRDSIDEAWAVIEEFFTTGLGSKVVAFITDTWNAIIGFFKPKATYVGSPGEGTEEIVMGPSEFMMFFGTFIESVKKIWGTVEEFFTTGLGSEVVAFITDTWNAIIGFFTPKTVYTGSPGEGTEEFKKAPSDFIEFFNDFIGDLTTAWNSVVAFFTEPGAIGYEILQFIGDIWGWIVGKIKELFGGGSDEVGKELGSNLGQIIGTVASASPGMLKAVGKLNESAVPSEEGASIGARLAEIFTGITQSITDAWNIVEEFFTSGIGSKIVTFIANTWGAIVAFFKPQTVYKGRTEDGDEEVVTGPSGFSTFFKSVIDGLTTAWDAVVNFFTSGIGSKIVTFASNTWAAIIGFFKPQTIYKGRAEDGTEEVVTGPSGFSTFFKSVIDGLTTAWDAVVNFFTSGIGSKIVTFASNTWAAIIGFFKPQTIYKGRTEDGTEEIVNGPSGFSTFFKSVIDGLTTAWDSVVVFFKEGFGRDIINFVGDTWAWIVSQFNSNNEVSSGDIPDVIDSDGVAKVEEKLGLLTGLFDSLDRLAASAVGEDRWGSIKDFVSGIIGSISDFVKELATHENLQQIENILVRAFSLLLDIIEKVISFIDKLVNPNGDYSAHIALFVAWMARLATLSVMPDVSGLNSLGMQLLEFAGAMTLIALAISIFGHMDLGVLAQGVIALGLIGSVLYFIASKVIKAFKVTEDALSEVSPTSGWERVVGSLVKWAGIAAVLEIFFKGMPDLIKAFSGSHVKVEDITSLMMTFAAIIGGLSIITGALSLMKADPGAIIKTSAALAVSMPILAVGLYATLTTLGGLIALLDSLGSNGLALQSLKDFLTDVGEVWVAVKQAFSGSLLDNLGNVEEAADTVENVDVESFEKLRDIMSILKEIGELMPRDASLGQFLSGERTTYNQLPNIFKKMGEAVNNFVAKTSSIDDAALEQADKVAEFLRRLMVVGTLASAFGDAGASATSVIKFLDELTNFGTGKASLWRSSQTDDLEKGIEGFISLADMFNEAILEAVPDINVDPLINAVYEGLINDTAKAKIMGAFQELGKEANKNGVDLTGGGVSGVDLSSLVNLFSSSGLSELFGNTENGAGWFSSIEEQLKNFNLDGEFDISKMIGITAEDGSSDMQAYISAMEEQLKGFSEENGLEANISMVLSDESLPDWFNGVGSLQVSGTVSIEQWSLASIQSTIINQTDRTVASILNAGSGIESRIDNLESAIRDMEFKLDTGEIAGVIDKKLGSLTTTASRTSMTGATTR